MQVIEDKYGRTFKTLRVSLLSTCNLGCIYCVQGDESLKLTNGAHPATSLPLSELLDTIRRLHAQLDLDTVRLTGGEPLLYHDLIGMIAGIRDLGISHIKLTTNGFLLQRLALPMKQAGMESVNVSLDAIGEEVFLQMSRRHSVQRILDGIDAALDCGLEVKLNAVIMRGKNDSQILPLLNFAFSRNIRIRFLEIMAMGHLHDQADKYLFTRDEILREIGRQYRFTPLDRLQSSTAGYWKTGDGHVFGVIANESQPFCHDCNRLRLDSHGNIYGCLSDNHPIALDKTDDENALRLKLEEALSRKQALKFTGSELSMLEIGG